MAVLHVPILVLTAVRVCVQIVNQEDIDKLLPATRPATSGERMGRQVDHHRALGQAYCRVLGDEAFREHAVSGSCLLCVCVRVLVVCVCACVDVCGRRRRASAWAAR